MRPQTLKPIDHNEGVFLIVTGVLLLMTLTSIIRVFSAGIVLTIFAGFMISVGSMNVVARLLEGGLMLPIKEQYYSFVFGDSICLLTNIAAIYLMRQHQQGATLADTGWWKLAWMAIGIASGLFWQLVMEANGKTANGEYVYSIGQLHGPTHLWHSLFVIPVFIYLFGSQLPLLFTSKWGINGLTSSLLASVPVMMIIAATIGFVFIVVYDGKHPKPNANVAIDWSHPFRQDKAR